MPTLAEMDVGDFWASRQRQYDYESARQAGIKPDETGHWASRVPHGEPPWKGGQRGLLLKSEDHKTFGMTVSGEETAGYKIYRGPDKRLYSFKEKPPADYVPYKGLKGLEMDTGDYWATHTSGEGLGGAVTKGVSNLPALWEAQAGGGLKALGEQEEIAASRLEEIRKSEKQGGILGKLKTIGQTVDLARHLVSPRAIAKATAVPEGRQRIEDMEQRLSKRGTEIYDRASKKLEENQFRGGGFGYYVNKAIEGGLGTMAPGFAAAWITRSPGAALPIMGTQVYGQKYAEQRKKGRTAAQAEADATFYALSEALTELIPLKHFLKGTGGIWKRAFKGALSEGAQEVLNEAMQIGYEMQVLDETMDLGTAMRRLVDAGIIGGLMGGVFGGSAAAADKVRGRKEAEEPPPGIPFEKVGPYEREEWEGRDLTGEAVTKYNLEQPGRQISREELDEAASRQFEMDKAAAAGTPEVTPLTQEEIDAEAQKAATSPESPESQPTEAQIEAGTYKKGHLKLFGLDISVENPRGSTRTGKDEDGKEWSREMAHHYGYIKGTVGRDKDHLDVFVGDDVPATEDVGVWVVDQLTPDGKVFDEHKVLLGYPSERAAREAYLANYEDGWQGLGAITQMDLEDFKDWAKDPAKTKVPVSSAIKVQPKAVPTEAKEELGEKIPPKVPSDQELLPPPVVYHGSPEDIEEPSFTDDIGIHFGTKRAAQSRLDATSKGKGFVKPFSIDLKNPIRAKWDPGTWDIPKDALDALPLKEDQRENALDLMYEKAPSNTDQLDVLADYLTSLGYDGITYGNAFEGDQSWIVFDGSQIKKAPKKIAKQPAEPKPTAAEQAVSEKIPPKSPSVPAEKPPAPEAPVVTGEVLTPTQEGAIEKARKLRQEVPVAIKNLQAGDQAHVERLLDEAEGDLDIVVLREGLKDAGYDPGRYPQLKIGKAEAEAAVRDLKGVIEGTKSPDIPTRVADTNKILPPGYRIEVTDSPIKGRKMLTAFDPGGKVLEQVHGTNHTVAGVENARDWIKRNAPKPPPKPKGKPLAEISMPPEEVEVAETGEKVTVTETAETALERVDAKLRKLYALMECLA